MLNEDITFSGRVMDKSKFLLIIDALINLMLGISLLLLIPFPELPRVLGVPQAANTFYPSILGAVLLGIGIALLMESNRTKPQQLIGLGLGGAVAINLCGGAVLITWLIFGDLNLPGYGMFLLWLIALTLIAISSIELIADRRKTGST
jgi:hypothetical protein